MQEPTPEPSSQEEEEVPSELASDMSDDGQLGMAEEGELEMDQDEFGDDMESGEEVLDDELVGSSDDDEPQ